MMNKQRGVSYIGIFVIIVMVGILLKALIAIWPHYYDDYIISKQLQEVLDSSTDAVTPEILLRDLDKRMGVNNLEVDVKKIMIITGAGSDLQVRKKYEVRENYYRGLGLVMKFDKTYSKGKAPINHLSEDEQAASKDVAK